MMCRPGSLWPESCGPHIDRGLDVLTLDFIGVRWYEPRLYSRPSLTMIRSWFLILYEESCGQESWDFILLWQMLEVSCVQNMLVFWRQSSGLLWTSEQSDERTGEKTCSSLMLSDFANQIPINSRLSPVEPKQPTIKSIPDLGKIKLKLPQT